MKNSQYRIGSCLLDVQTMNLINGNSSTKLSTKVFKLLSLFLISQEHVVSRQKAIEDIWLGNEGVGERGFTNGIWALRKAFKELGIEDEVFLTLPKVGYQLTLLVEPIPSKNSANIIQRLNGLSIKTIAFTVTVLSLIVFSFYSLTSKTKVEITSPQTNGVKAEDHIRITNYEGVEEHPAVSHNGKYLAFQWFRNGHKGNVYIKELDKSSTPLKLVTMSNDEEASPSWSASDSSLAYVRILADGQCQIRARRLVTHEDIFIDEGCFYQPFTRVITWSNQHDDTILYTKSIGNGAALFSYNFKSQAIQQVTFPEGNMIDFAPHFSADNSQIAFIRQKGSQQFSLVLQDENQSLTTLLKDQVSIIDFDWDYENNALFVNYATAGRHKLERLSLDNSVRTLISNLGLPSNLSFNSVSKALYFSDHISKEYVALLSFENGKTLRRISSSSRDMYGRYVANNGSIMFLSNRSNYWSLWLNNKFESINVSKELGNATVPAISPDSKTFAVSITSETDQQSQLYLGSTDTGQLQKIPTNGLYAENLNWSRDGLSLYFFASTANNAGIYRLTIASNKIEQLTRNGEHYAVEGTNGNLYYSNNNQKGIWQLDLLTQESTLLTDELATYDYGSFFWRNDSLIYLHRDENEDQIKSINNKGEMAVLLTYPAHTIRKYFGISPANDDSFMATLKITNEADISAVPVANAANNF